MLKVGILTIGDEILIGQIINTNSSWIAQRCLEIGASVVEQRAVGDNEQDIISATGELLNKVDVLLITGGLGPTSDDLTKPALSKYFNSSLLFDENVFNWIKEFYFKRGVTEITERNKNLAFIPDKCQPLKNELGTAPGLIFQLEDKIVVSMPGVPKEMQFIMNSYIIPILKDKIINKNLNTHIYQILQTCGIPESKLADRLQSIETHSDGVKIAFLPSYKGVRLRLETKDIPLNEGLRKIETIKNEISNLVGDFIYSEGEISLSEVIGKILKDRKETVAVAESCTGGLLGSEFTKIPGSSEYFLGGIIAYSNDVKTGLLKVKKETIDNFGAVSENTAVEMAVNVRKILNSTYGISITGIAGPGGETPNKPIGTVWIGLATPESTLSELHHFGGDREINRERSVASALTMLYFYLKGSKK